MKFSLLVLLAIAQSYPAAEGLHSTTRTHCKLLTSNLTVTEEDGCTGVVVVTKCAGDCESSMIPRVFP